MLATVRSREDLPEFRYPLTFTLKTKEEPLGPSGSASCTWGAGGKNFRTSDCTQATPARSRGPCALRPCLPIPSLQQELP